MQIASYQEDRVASDALVAHSSSDRMFARQYPPVPRDRSSYSQAKRAEYDGNIDMALSLYLHAIKHDDRRDSSIKDYAGLLHMLGRTQEAVDFLVEHRKFVKNTLGFNNLIDQMQNAIQNFESTRSLPRTLIVQCDHSEGITRTSLSLIFPNPAKVIKITPFNTCKSKAIIEFATHSAARKALNVPKAESVKCAWAPASCQSGSPPCDGALIRDDADWDAIMSSPDSQKRRLDLYRPSPLLDIHQPVQMDWCMETPSPIRAFSSFF